VDKSVTTTAERNFSKCGYNVHEVHGVNLVPILVDNQWVICPQLKKVYKCQSSIVSDAPVL
jgi:hypothetical protein